MRYRTPVHYFLSSEGRFCIVLTAVGVAISERELHLSFLPLRRLLSEIIITRTYSDPLRKNMGSLRSQHQASIRILSPMDRKCLYITDTCTHLRRLPTHHSPRHVASTGRIHRSMLGSSRVRQVDRLCVTFPYTMAAWCIGEKCTNDLRSCRTTTSLGPCRGMLHGSRGPYGFLMLRYAADRRIEYVSFLEVSSLFQLRSKFIDK